MNNLDIVDVLDALFISSAPMTARPLRELAATSEYLRSRASGRPRNIADLAPAYGTAAEDIRPRIWAVTCVLAGECPICAPVQAISRIARAMHIVQTTLVQTP